MEAEVQVKHFKVAIIGAGFSGLGMAINLRKPARTISSSSNESRG
jgi:cation diffusion facilitator CzcD-associated flavoprotein CzcO